MARRKSKSKPKNRRKYTRIGVNYKVVNKPRFTGFDTVFEPWFHFMEKVSIRFYHGGHFVSRKGKTTYEGGGMLLKPNVEEVCYFEFVYWIRTELKYSDVGEIWFRQRGKSLHNGRAQLKGDGEISEFLESPEEDGWYHLYVLHSNKELGGKKDLASCGYGPNFRGFYKEKELTQSSCQSNNVVGSGGNIQMPISSWESFGDLVGATNGTTFGNSISLIKLPSSGTLNTSSPSIGKQKLPTKSAKKKQVPQQHITQTVPNPNSLQHSNPSLNQNLPPTVPNPNPTPILPNPIPIPTVPNPNPSPAVQNKRRHEEDSAGEEENESEDGGGDAELSDDDIEDREETDLWNINNANEISDKVQDTVKGLRVEVRESESDDDSGNDEDFNEGEAADIEDSDDEVVSEVGSDDDSTQYPEFNPKTDFRTNIKLSKGLKFGSGPLVRKALRHHAIENGYDFYFLHNTKRRISVYCSQRCDCPWKRARLVKCQCKSKKKCRYKVHVKKLKLEDTWQIKSLRVKHICSHVLNNTRVTSEYLAERYLDDFRDNTGWKVAPFLKRAKRELKVDIKYYKAYYARGIAMKMLFGDATLEYERVWDYAATIRKYNPGSTAIVKVEGVESPKPTFQRMYICLQGCKEGFLAGCRPIIGVDGAHLRGPYPGILLTAVGKDGNQNIFPVAWAVVEVENSESWTWFLELLREDLISVADQVTWVHEDDELTYMSDRQKGLLDAFKKVMPQAETRFCCRHIWANFKNKFPGVAYREHFWKAARSSTKHHFKQHMEKIKGINEEAYKYLMGIPTCHWSRHSFSTSSKSGMLLNNCCESFNSVLRDARSKPIIQLMEWIRRYVMSRACAKREGLNKFTGQIMPSVMKMCNKGLQESSNMRITDCDLVEFEVDHEDSTYLVNLENRTCTCFRWSLMGIPCWHALACIQRRRLNFKDYIHPAYHVSTYAKAYAPKIGGLPGHTQWEETPYPKPLPPPHRIMPGRPSEKKRKKEAGEACEKKNVERAKKQNCCSRCGGSGHYKNKCTQPMTQAEAEKSKGGRPENATTKKGPRNTKKKSSKKATKAKEGNANQGAAQLNNQEVFNSTQGAPTD